MLGGAPHAATRGPRATWLAPAPAVHAMAPKAWGDRGLRRGRDLPVGSEASEVINAHQIEQIKLGAQALGHPGRVHPVSSLEKDLQRVFEATSRDESHPELFEHDGNLVAVWCRPKIEIEDRTHWSHVTLPSE